MAIINIQIFLKNQNCKQKKNTKEFGICGKTNKKKGKNKMTSVIKYSLLFIMFVCVLLICLDINSIDTRKTELQQTAEISMRNVLKGTTINKMYPMDDDEMNVELVRNIADNINTDSDLTINVLDINNQGLIDLNLITSFTHLNGVKDNRSIRKTMITEKYENEKQYQEYNYDSVVTQMLIDKKITVTNSKAFSFDKDTGTITGFNSSADTSNNGYLVIPKSIDGVTVKSIGLNAFNPYNGGKKIILPNTVLLIDSYAFSNATMRDLVLPPSIVTINYNAFMNVTLNSMTFTNVIPPNFQSHSQNLISPTGTLNIYVPNNTIEAYTNALCNIVSDKVHIYEMEDN